MEKCPFCECERETISSYEEVFAIFDGFPVSPGHALIIPKRHFSSYFDATDEERHCLWQAVEDVKRHIEEKYRPQGYNIGINCGDAAGQTIPHLHIHIIPRYSGDTPDPRGGVRHVIPGKGNYRLAPSLTKGGKDPFIEHLKPLFSEATRIDMVVSFVRSSGLRMIENYLLDARDRNVPIRVLTGDYLDITEVEALNLLLDWSFDSRITAFVYESETESFHPKSYIFHCQNGGSAFVGSSNLSYSALGSGIEWNYRVEEKREPEGFRKIAEAFDELLNSTSVKPLDNSWLQKYRDRCRAAISKLIPSEAIEPETSAETPVPHKIQQEALKALKKTRETGYKAGLIVLATGLGKTYLAAFDSVEFKKILFVAHRDEILSQSQATFRKVRPTDLFGVYTGKEKNIDAEVIFASVQTLCRKEHLERFEKYSFDYIVVDEFHHACASTYQKIISYFNPKFLLGLTATPERYDQGDLMTLCENNIVYEKGIVGGILEHMLVPFEYYGLIDPVDYKDIPWRNGRFDPQILETAVDTEARARKIYEEWKNKSGKRTLAFCCSTTHANYMANYFKEKWEIKAAAVHSGKGSAPRAASLEQLENNELDIIFTVDIFNEGIDLPILDTILMIRPTESPVIFLQQMGRGLRIAPGKEKLIVIDFIGNHKSFLMKPRTLLSLGRSIKELAKALEELKEGIAKLPRDCKMNFETGLIDMMKEFIKISSLEAIETLYREFKEINGRRLNATELFQTGLSFGAIRKNYGGWFEFLKSQGDLTSEELLLLEIVPSWFNELETTKMQKSYKMITLKALIEEDALNNSIPIEKLAKRSYEIISRNPLLLKDIDAVDIADPKNPDENKWIVYWEKNPVAAWSGEWSSSGVRYFEYKKPRFTSLLPVPEDLKAVFIEMTEELINYRLSAYESKAALISDSAKQSETFRAKIIHNRSYPIIKLPDRKKNPDVPHGEYIVIVDDEQYQARFMKEFLNVMGMTGRKGNVLPEILRKWFGPMAGQPGTSYFVTFEHVGEHFIMRPEDIQVRAKVIPLPNLQRVPFYKELRAACGAFKSGIQNNDSIEKDTIDIATTRRSIDLNKHFITVADGSSMDGGTTPIKDGDLVLMEWTTAVSPSDIMGRICLVEKLESDDTSSFAIKRIKKEGNSYYLKSENPPDLLDKVNYDSIRPVARFIEVVHPAPDESE